MKKCAQGCGCAQRPDTQCRKKKRKKKMAASSSSPSPVKNLWSTHARAAAVIERRINLLDEAEKTALFAPAATSSDASAPDGELAKGPVELALGDESCDSYFFCC